MSPLRHFISILDVTPTELRSLVTTAVKLKTLPAASQCQLLPHTTMTLIFEKPSLRTRVSFERGVAQLGGTSLYLSGEQVGLGVREPIRDVARVLSRMTTFITARVMKHETVTQLAQHATVPVINALCDREHPCQALADMVTIYEHKNHKLDKSLKVAFVGDGNNNVTHSLALACARLGVTFAVASPMGFEMDKTIADRAKSDARDHGATVTESHDIFKAVEGADVVYTDTWVSMGQEVDKARRLAIFKGFQITPQVMNAAKPDAIFMHDMPAYRGYEVHEDVIDGSRSVIIDQAENRLHAQKAIICLLGNADVESKIGVQQKQKSKQ